LISSGTVSLHAQVTQAGTTRNLEDTIAADAASPEEDVILRLDHAKARKRIMALVQEVLGERERAVFLTRCMHDGDEVVRVETLAREFGVTRERVCQLEASAKRKIAMALAQEGYANFAAGAPITLPQNRAGRRRTQAVLPVGEVAAATG
jgi:RNA polymerase sigma-32 factor